MFNGIFELSASLFLWNNVRMLYKHKVVKGVSILSITVFTLWGFWNLYYYPWLSQWSSFIGGLGVVSANVTWVYLALRYKKRRESNE